MTYSCCIKLIISMISLLSLLLVVLEKRYSLSFMIVCLVHILVCVRQLLLCSYEFGGHVWRLQ